MQVDIRPYQTSDVDAFYELIAASYAHLEPWMPWVTDTYIKTDTEQWVTQCLKDWQNRVAFRYLIVDAESDALLGATGLERIQWDNKTAELGYWVGHNAVNKNVATRAALKTVERAFQDFGLERVELLILTDNDASNAVAKKMGAHLEGTLRNRLMHEGKSRDVYCFSLIPSDLNGSY